MQTTLAENIRDTPQGREADAILRSCVHCGFCLATCPTYQLLGDELDSPRGRIYLMKQMLEGEPVTARTQLHLDRCLTCRACETTCPSGVKYGRLLDIGRAMTEERVERPPISALKRYVLRKVLPHRRRFATLLVLARAVRWILPREIRAKIPERRATSTWQEQGWPAVRHARRVVVLGGCVQSTLEPGIDIAAAQVLDKVGISAVRASGAGCCGAVAHHLSAHDETLQQLRRNIDALWPHVESGVEAVVVTASACTAMVTDYGHLLRDDPQYAERAARVSALVRDISQVVLAEVGALQKALRRGAASDGTSIAAAGASIAKAKVKVAFHSPCTLQHGLKVKGVVEALLTEAGFSLTDVPDSHLCCGSAGTYSILQPGLSSRLLTDKVAALSQGSPGVIATANIGCLAHIRGGTSVAVRHWIELVAARLQESPTPGE
ncbi:MAG: glycolate oxidase iron-sulfur subunit [Gammaproteobacteria bacterium]|jgi:glycolate oxidase iron-sulfur subunit|nr:glycolate oxidase iron-sulfur subunit [Gammaproteobacteria bacterium]